MKIRVYYEDTDVGGVVYYANYLKYIERARSELFFDKGLSPVITTDHGTGHFVVRRVEADYLFSARLGDIIEVKTVVEQIKGATMTLRQTISDDKERVIFCALVTLVFLNETKPRRIPAFILELFSSISR